MPIDTVRSDGKPENQAPMAGSGAGFDQQDGHKTATLVPGDAWDAFLQFKTLVASLENSPDLEVLNNHEIRMFKSLRILLDMAGAMSTDAMRMHVLAHWRASSEGIRKLPIGAQAAALIKIIDAGAGVR